MCLQNDWPNIQKHRYQDFKESLPAPLNENIQHHMHVRKWNDIAKHGQDPSHRKDPNINPKLEDLHKRKSTRWRYRS